MHSSEIKHDILSLSGKRTTAALSSMLIIVYMKSCKNFFNKTRARRFVPGEAANNVRNTNHSQSEILL